MLLHWWVLPMIVLLHHTLKSKPLLWYHGLCLPSASCICYHLLSCKHLSPMPRHHCTCPHVWWGAKEQSQLDIYQHYPKVVPASCINHTRAKYESMMRKIGSRWWCWQWSWYAKQPYQKMKRKKTAALAIAWEFCCLKQSHRSHVLCMNGHDHWFQCQLYLRQDLLDGSSLFVQQNQCFLFGTCDVRDDVLHQILY